MTKDNKRLIIFFILLLSFFLIIFLNVQINCPIKKYFHIACPGCGLTRSIFSLLKFKIIDSLNYNILGLPLFITMGISYILIIVDILKQKNYLFHFWKLITKHYKLIIVLVIITFILNNFQQI